MSSDDDDKDNDHKASSDQNDRREKGEMERYVRVRGKTDVEVEKRKVRRSQHKDDSNQLTLSVKDVRVSSCNIVIELVEFFSRQPYDRGRLILELDIAVDGHNNQSFFIDFRNCGKACR